MRTNSSRGEELARGVGRHLKARGFACLEEFIPAPGLRVDVIALSQKGFLWIIECKSSQLDFYSDKKWHKYLPYCDQFFFAVDRSFPHHILPSDVGLIIADKYDAETIRLGSTLKVSPGRRKSITIKLAFNATERYGYLKESMYRRSILSRW
ncbi:MAG: MmcB family DNA repair protein [Rhodobacteraceae bacterium]|nr:MmcB family DNA repair protein [Paracoccaceae bacterium]